MKEIKVLGPGCAKCLELMKQTEQAVSELNLEYSVEKITDIDNILSYGVMMTPALVVNGEVKATGKVPSLDEIKKLIAHVEYILSKLGDQKLLLEGEVKKKVFSRFAYYRWSFWKYRRWFKRRFPHITDK